MTRKASRFAATGLGALLAVAPMLAGADAGLVATAAAAEPRRAPAPATQRGEASYYAERLHGRRMANGERFDRNSNAAAHRHLPLGALARVTNLANGRSEVVRIKDRGPYAKGRIIDLSPRTAERLAMRKEGTARVVVTLLELPTGSGRD